MACSSNSCVLTTSFAGAFCFKNEVKILVDLGGVIYLRLIIFFLLTRVLMSQNVNKGISIMDLPIRTNQNALSGTKHKILSG